MDHTLAQILALSVLSIAIEQFIYFLAWLVGKMPPRTT